MTSTGLTGAGTLGNVKDPLDGEGLGALEITEDRCQQKILSNEIVSLVWHAYRN